MPAGDSDDDAMLAIADAAPIPAPPALAAVVPLLRDLTLRLSNGSLIDVKFSSSHSSGNIRAWCTCPRHDACNKWRQLNQFKNEQHILSWLFEWAELALADDELDSYNHIWLSQPTEAAVEARMDHLPVV